MAPVHLDDVDGHELAAIGARQLAAEVDDELVDRPAAEAEDGALDGVGWGTGGHDGSLPPPAAAGRGDSGMGSAHARSSRAALSRSAP